MKKVKRFLVCLPVIIVIFLNMSLPVFAAEIVDADKCIIQFDSLDLTPRDAMDYAMAQGYTDLSLNPYTMHYAIYLRSHTDTSSNTTYSYRVYFISCDDDTEVEFGYVSNRPDNFRLRSDNAIKFFSFTMSITYNWPVSDGYGTSYSSYPDTVYTDSSGQWHNFTSDGTLTYTDLLDNPEDDEFIASIDLVDNNSAFEYTFENLTEDKSYWLKYGVQSVGWNSSTKTSPGGNYRDSYSIQDFKDWADDHDIDYQECTAYLSVFDESGETLLENVTLSLADGVIDEDGMYNEKKEYVPLELPDIDDYVDWTDWPDFPELEPLPSFPDITVLEPAPQWDSDNILQSIFNLIKWLAEGAIGFGFSDLFKILKWMAECESTLLRNIITVLSWFDSVVVEGFKKIGQLFLWLSDCFIAIVENIITNIGIALYNLIVDIRALVSYLFVPKKKNISDIISEKFPIYEQIQHIFLSLSSGASSVSFTFLDQNVTLNLASGFSAYFSSALYSFSTIAFDVMTVLQIFKLVLSVLDITVESSVQSVSDN